MRRVGFPPFNQDFKHNCSAADGYEEAEEDGICDGPTE